MNQSHSAAVASSCNMFSLKTTTQSARESAIGVHQTPASQNNYIGVQANKRKTMGPLIGGKKVGITRGVTPYNNKNHIGLNKVGSTSCLYVVDEEEKIKTISNSVCSIQKQ